MDTSSLIVAITSVTTLIALFTGVALPFIAASRPGRRHAGERLASADAQTPISAALRTARPPGPGADDAPLPGYLYVPSVGIRYHGSPAQTDHWVQEVPIVKKTAKWIYYTSDSWDRHEAVVSPGRISREQFETDTRCHSECQRDIAADRVCAPHGRSHHHCVHVLAPGPDCHAPGGCGQDCPADTRGVRYARPGHTWQHCPHGEDQCHHGYPAGVIPIPGHRHRPGPAGRLFFATRQAAEDHLYRSERQRAEQAPAQAPPIKELRRAMADAHPDRGGTAEQFIQARHRYQTALQVGTRRRLGTSTDATDPRGGGS
jgi:hypothetical protein